MIRRETRCQMPFLKSLFTLEGKNAIVTGTASGLGQHCAETRARAGARVALFDINQDGLTETAARIKEIGGPSVSQVVDISQTKAIDAGVSSKRSAPSTS
jgi:NAD(P)-dependent dehydrogenase (short-subunit alcohol dehydrogenase family)